MLRRFHRWFWVMALVVLTGCISPQVTVNKTIYVSTEGNVTVHMNSGTSIEAEVEQQVKDLVDATIPLQ